MKAIPTLEGGLRIDVEEPSDWEMLRSIIRDANSTSIDLATRLGGLMSEEAGGEDWREYVVPDLREAFLDELAQVGALIEMAIFEAQGEAGPIWITPDDAYPWYSALNQARLAIEERFHFGADPEFDFPNPTPEQVAAFIRSHQYFVFQEMLMKHVMR